MERWIGLLDVRLKLWFLCSFLILLLLALGVWWGAAEGLGSDSVVGILLVLGILGHAFSRVFQLTSRGVGIEMGYPPTAYGLFFALYHLLPYLVAVITGVLPARLHLPIASLLCLGYVGWQIGILLNASRSQRIVPADFLMRSDAVALLLTCLLAITLIGISILKRIATGQLYTHAFYYEQELTLEASIFSVIAHEFEVPVLLLLGLLAHNGDPSIRTISRRLFYGYSAGIFLVFVLSSRTRPAITVLLFFFLSLGLHRRFILKLAHVFLLLCLGIVAVLIIQGLRVSDRDFANSDNQLKYALTHMLSKGIGNASESMDTVIDNVHNRSCGGTVFLAEILDACETHPYLYGSDIFTGIGTLIPRVIWSEKPISVPPQILIERRLDIWQHDAAVTSVNQFYAEAGYGGVAIGHIFLGWILGSLFFRLTNRPTIPVLLVFFFLWGRICNMEHEVVLGGLSTLRTAVLFYIVYKFVRLFIAHPRVPIPSPVSTSGSLSHNNASHGPR